ncbi:uncharacterized protein LOC131021570 [Salvia miltiorrhiza]|uniref:uncharacterized protein LOC131021570 n=1 Tax=Salvia miltiorrhiza TaxID=226208 RepID=UPI0025AD4CCC|nr:uncharacterized protein LOC131021570 [Salvia miltiorrhiza]
MESYSSISNTDSSSSASYSFSSNSSTHYLYNPCRQATKSAKPQPSFRSALHTVRKSPAKNVITKKPIAPLPPTPPRIYKVEPIEFKDVVQKLTGAGELQSTRLREVAPPPLSLSPRFVPHSAENEEEKRQKSFDTSFGILSPLGFSLSPSSLAWCSAMLLSPGTLASFETSAVI